MEYNSRVAFFVTFPFRNREAAQQRQTVNNRKICFHHCHVGQWHGIEYRAAHSQCIESSSFVYFNFSFIRPTTHWNSLMPCAPWNADMARRILNSFTAPSQPVTTISDHSFILHAHPFTYPKRVADGVAAASVIMPSQNFVPPFSHFVFPFFS